MKGFRYTIGTENKNKQALIKIVNAVISGFTVTEGIGGWMGSLEDSLTFDFTLTECEMKHDHTIECKNEFDCDARANFIASEIRAFNSQEAVILIKQPVEVFYIYT